MKNFFLKKFITPPFKDSLRDLKEKTPSYWERKGERMVMKLFRAVSETVPAYQNLLAEHGISSDSIKNIADYKKLPVIDKDSYLRKYKYTDLFPFGVLGTATTFSATSGSTGEPFYVPRGEEHDARYKYIADIFLKDTFEIEKHTTLGIIGFGLGIWIGGIFTYKTFNDIATNNKKTFTVAPVGPHLDIFLNTVQQLGSFYDQVIFMGYPPFIKEVLDEGEARGISWGDYRIKIFTAAEGFSETFREYLAKKAHVNNILTDIVSIYGTVELGTMAFETPLTSLVRTNLEKNKETLSIIFPKATVMPTLAQYDPSIIYFEEEKGEIVASGFSSSIPLLRYRFPDRGGVISFVEMVKKLEEAGIDILDKAKCAGIKARVFQLPFVYVNDRSDDVVFLMSINIYPQIVRDALIDPLLQTSITGKFFLSKKWTKMKNEYLHIDVELKKNSIPGKTLKKQTEKTIFDRLYNKSSEFNYLSSVSPHLHSKIKVVFRKYGDERYFKRGMKQKWV